MGRIGLAIAVLALAGCADIPRDPEGTEALVRKTGAIRIGWTMGAQPDPAVLVALGKLQSETGASIQSRVADGETLLSELEDGKLDLVYGRYAMDSPWAPKVHLGRALGLREEPAKTVAAPRFAMRNGENGWIMRVEKAARP